jgi:hypothetical protein
VEKRGITLSINGLIVEKQNLLSVRDAISKNHTNSIILMENIDGLCQIGSGYVEVVIPKFTKNIKISGAIKIKLEFCPECEEKGERVRLVNDSGCQHCPVCAWSVCL